MEPTERTELLAQVHGQLDQLGSAAAVLRAATTPDEAMLAQVDAAQAELSRLSTSLSSTASPVSLHQARAAIAAGSGRVVSLLAQVQHAAGAETAKQATVALQQATASSQQLGQEAHAALFRDKQFDRHLTFASPDDESAYRLREDARRLFVEEQQRHPGDPAAALAGLQAEREQLQDAIAHGAGRDPAAGRLLDRLNKGIESQRQAMIAEGRSPEQIDKDVAETVRKHLKKQGVGDAEIERRLAGNSNPISAISGGDLRHSSAAAVISQLQTVSPDVGGAPIVRVLPSLHAAEAQQSDILRVP